MQPRTRMVHTRNEKRAAVLAGAMAGLSAGIALTVLMTVMSAANHRDIWYAMKGAAAPFAGARAMTPGFDLPTVAQGLLDHLAISLGWGVLFALAFWGLGRGTTLAAGVLWAFVVWIGMYYVVLPIVGLEAMRNDAPVPRAIAFHLFYSLLVAGFFLLFRPLLGGPPVEHKRIGRRHHAHAV
jgi:hypothetical protein